MFWRREVVASMSLRCEVIAPCVQIRYSVAFSLVLDIEALLHESHPAKGGSGDRNPFSGLDAYFQEKTTGTGSNIGCTAMFQKVRPCYPRLYLPCFRV